MKFDLKKVMKNLGIWILIAMIAGIIAGAIMGKQASVFKPLGDIFIQLIKMLVIPLVAVSIISGAASIGNTKSAGKVGFGTFGYYILTTCIAVIIGLVLGNIFEPGIGLNVEQIKAMYSDEYASRGGTPGFWETIKGIIPANPLKAMIDGNILQILFFCLFLGFGISALDENKKEKVTSLFNTFTEALIWMIERVMLIAPLGVFGLLADAVGTFGYDILSLVVKLLAVYVFALIIQAYGVYPLFIKLFSKTSPLKFLAKISKAQIVALSTSSSMATLPVTMDVCEKELDVSNETSSFVLPLGATINMDGNAINYALVAVFFAQLFNIDLSMGQYIAIMLTATIGSIGQAGVPGPSLLVVAVLVAANIPLVGLPLIFGVDRIFDMLRTAVNITGDASCAVVMENMLEKSKK